MEIGLVFALLSALCFGVGPVFLRRGVSQAGESFSAVLISAFIGIILFSFWLPFTGEWSKLWSLSLQGFILLGTAGIIHFVVGRLLYYSSVRLIGANKASPLIQTGSFYAVIFGILFLNESLTIFLIPGVLCIAAGATLVSVGKEVKIAKMQSKGILNGLGAALCWGISGVLIRSVIEEIGSPSAAAFVSYIVALPVVAGLLLRQEQRDQLTQLRRASLVPLVISGIFISIAQLLRYTALSYSPVSVVQPVIGTSVLFVFFLSFLINRNIEVFTRKVFAGIVATVVGIFLFFL